LCIHTMKNIAILCLLRLQTKRLIFAEAKRCLRKEEC
jgi:hypothetical protein